MQGETMRKEFWVVQDKDGFFQGLDREFYVPYGASRNVWFSTVARFDTKEEAERLADAYGKGHSYKIRKLLALFDVE